MKTYIKFASVLILFMAYILLLTSSPVDSRAGGGSSYGGSRRSSGSSGSSSSSGSRRSSGSGSSGSTHRYTPSAPSHGSQSTSTPNNHNTATPHSPQNYHHTPGTSYQHGQSCSPCCCFAVFLVSIIIIIVLISIMKKSPNTAPDSGNKKTEASGRITVAEQIRKFKERDTNFSRPLFMDFVHVLYTRFHNARGDKAWGSLRAYISEQVMQWAESEARSVINISNVVMGAGDIDEIDESGKDSDLIIVTIEANYEEKSSTQESPVIYYTNEIWEFERAKGILSKGPDDISVLSCPSCGSPSEPRPDGTCPYCSNVVNRGTFHWVVRSMEVADKYPRPPLEISGGVEVGTTRDTLMQPGFENEKGTFISRNPGFSWDEFNVRVTSAFTAIQDAWSSRAWEKARPYETEHLFSTHRYWIDRYLAEGRVNHLEEIKISKIEVVKIEPDAFFETITVRIAAAMKDFTTDSRGTIIEGDRTKDRFFSEYWTFIRKKGFTDAGRAIKASGCPNCGAPLSVNMSGVCSYCNTMITSGNFDWVLSSIEQDEAYQG